MKTKKIFLVLISVMILFSSFVVSAGVLPPQDSAAWKNLTDKEADRLLTSKSESFIFFFYRDICPNSQRSIPTLINYAKKNNMSFYGLNCNDYPTWMTWSTFGKNSVGFPYIIVYNAGEDIVESQDNVFTVKEFEALLSRAKMTPGSSAVPNFTDKPLFSDVPKTNAYYEAINALADDGVLSGYEDGTFKPTNFISRTEAAVIIVRAGDLVLQTLKDSTYTDVANDFWGKDYIMSASEAGIIKGMGNGIFAPQSNVTRTQIIKMIVCMVGLEQEATEKGGWPNGYLKVALDNKIIDIDTYSILLGSDYGIDPATRGEVAQWIYNSRVIRGGGFKVAGKTYELGMAESELGTPDESMTSVYGFTWKVYGTDTYEKFFAAGVKNGKIVALASAGVGFEYNGYKAGQTLSVDLHDAGDYMIDKNDGNIIHGVFLVEKNLLNESPYDLSGLTSESKINFHFTNAFRVYHKLKPYTWDENAADAARLHSADMATNNYFNHTGLDGRNMGDRMSAQGIKWMSCAENIHAGSSLGVKAYNNWVNSSGHRKNLLGSCTHMGVGFAYNKNSEYKFYATQNFYSRSGGSSVWDSFIQ